MIRFILDLRAAHSWSSDATTLALSFAGPSAVPRPPPVMGNIAAQLRSDPLSVFTNDDTAVANNHDDIEMLLRSDSEKHKRDISAHSSSGQSSNGSSENPAHIWDQDKAVFVPVPLTKKPSAPRL